MVNPFAVTNNRRTDAQLQEFLIFSICVAGKMAVTISRKVDQFLKSAAGVYGKHKPFDLLGYMHREGVTCQFLREAKLGKYRLLTRAFGQLAVKHERGLSLKKCSVQELEEIDGVGRKTSRFFMLHSRPQERVAVLDTHVLQYLRDRGIDAPRATPASRQRYAQLEEAFIGMADEAGMGVADFDLDIWKRYTKTKPLEVAGKQECL